MLTTNAAHNQAVFFDLDGTLIDTAPDLVAALYAACDAHGRERPAYQHAAIQVANGGNGLVRLAFPDADAALHAAALETLLGHYAEHIADRSALYPGLDTLLAQLERHGIDWGIVTNKPQALAEKLLSTLQLDRRSACLVGGDTLPVRKPDPAPLIFAAGWLKKRPDQCIYVGDHQRDIDAARAAGMVSIAAGYGYLGDDQPVERWQADFVVSEPQALGNALVAAGLPDTVLSR